MLTIFFCFGTEITKSFPFPKISDEKTPSPGKITLNFCPTDKTNIKTEIASGIKLLRIYRFVKLEF